MNKKIKYNIIAIITLLIFSVGGYLIFKQVKYNNSNPYVKEGLNADDFSSIEFLEPALNEHGEENAYVFNRYTTTSKNDIKRIVEFINQLKYSDEFIKGDNIELGVPRRLNLYGGGGATVYEVLFSKNMDSIIFPDEEVPRYSQYPIFQNTKILELMKDEIQDVLDMTTDMKSVG